MVDINCKIVMFEGESMRIYRTFPEGKTKVLTLSYDDGRQADRRLVSILNKHGIKGTFNLNYGLMKQAERVGMEEVAELYKGHEIATHAYRHPTLARCPATQIYREILEDKKGWESLTGRPVKGHAYPNGSYSEEVKSIFKSVGIAYARTVNENAALGINRAFDLPTDWLEWNATCHHNHNLMALAERFVEFKSIHYLKMMYVWGHSYEFDNDNNWDLIEKFCEYIGGREDIWYATNIEIKEYIDVCDRLEFAADESFVYNPSATDAWLSVDAQTVKVPGGSLVSLV